MQLPPTVLSLNRKVSEARPRESKSARSKEKGSRSEQPTGANVRPLEGTRDGSQMLDSSDFDDVGGAHGEMDEDNEVNEVVAATQPKEKGTKTTGLRPPRTLETTLFDRLEQMYGPSIKRLLDVQYR
jgi:DNA polymerase alpha-associated DNA helicase A